MRKHWKKVFSLSAIISMSTLAQQLGTPYQGNNNYNFIGTTYISDPNDLSSSVMNLTNYRESKKQGNTGGFPWKPSGDPYTVPKDYFDAHKDELTKPTPAECPNYPLRLTSLSSSYSRDPHQDPLVRGAFQDCYFEMGRNDCFEGLAYGMNTGEEMGSFLNKIDCGPSCKLGSDPDHKVLCRDEIDKPKFRFVREDNKTSYPYPASNVSNQTYGLFSPEKFPGSSIAIKPSRYGMPTTVGGITDNTDYGATGIRGTQILNLFLPFSQSQLDTDTNVKLDSVSGPMSITENLQRNFVLAKQNIVKDQIISWAKDRDLTLHQKLPSFGQAGSGDRDFSALIATYLNNGRDDQNMNAWKTWAEAKKAPSELLSTRNAEMYKLMVKEIYTKMDEFYKNIKSNEIGLCLRFDPVSTHYSPKLALTPYINAPGPKEIISQNSSDRNGFIQSRLQADKYDNQGYNMAYEYGFKKTGVNPSTGDNVYASSGKPAPALNCPMADWAFSTKEVTTRASCTGDAPQIEGKKPEVPKSDPPVEITAPEGKCRCFDDDGKKLYNEDVMCYGWKDDTGKDYYYFIDCSKASYRGKGLDDYLPFDLSYSKISCDQKVMINGLETNCCQDWRNKPELKEACRIKVQNTHK